MPNTYFQFKQFRIDQSKSAMKVTTEGCILGAWTCGESPKRILDIGTGTGLLSLMLAQRYSEAQIDAVEVQKEAFEEARANFEASPWSDRLNVYHSRIQDFTPLEAYDLIVCNPPFFAASLKSANSSKNTAKHEGSLTQEELILAIDRLLAPHGVAHILYPAPEMNALLPLALKSGFSPSGKLTIRNKPEGPIFRVICSLCRKERELQESELVIKEDVGYSEEFIKLLGSYYLEL